MARAGLMDAMGRPVKAREDAEDPDLSSATVTTYRRYIDAASTYLPRWIRYTWSQS